MSWHPRFFPHPEGAVVFALGSVIHVVERASHEVLRLPDGFDQVEEVRFWGVHHDVWARLQLGGDVWGCAWWQGERLVGAIRDCWMKASVAAGGSRMFRIEERDTGTQLIATELADGSEVWRTELPAECSSANGVPGLSAYDAGVIVVASSGGWWTFDLDGHPQRAGRGTWNGDVEHVEAEPGGKHVVFAVAGTEGCFLLDVDGECRHIPFF